MLGQASGLESGLSTKQSWYAAYTKHQHEKSASEYLALKGFEVVLPLYSAIHRWKDRTRVIQLPVFPCYLFIKMSLVHKLDVLSTPGIFWMVENGGHACAVSDADMEAVRRASLHPKKMQPHPYLSAGDWVRVRSGPLAGIEGILTKVKNQCRVVLSIALLQKSVAIEIDQALLDLVPARSTEAHTHQPVRKIA